MLPLLLLTAGLTPAAGPCTGPTCSAFSPGELVVVWEAGGLPVSAVPPARKSVYPAAGVYAGGTLPAGPAVGFTGTGCEAGVSAVGFRPVRRLLSRFADRPRLFARLFGRKCGG